MGPLDHRNDICHNADAFLHGEVGVEFCSLESPASKRCLRGQKGIRPSAALEGAALARNPKPKASKPYVSPKAPKNPLNLFKLSSLFFDNP